MRIKKTVLISFILLSIGITTFGQSWEYETILDGNIKVDIAQVVAQGYEESINSPMLGVLYSTDTDQTDIFLHNLENVQCSNKTAYFKFNGSSKIYYCNPYVIDGLPFWYIDHALIWNDNFFNTLELFKKYSSVTVTVASACGKKDFTFSLSGSTKAIIYVAE